MIIKNVKIQNFGNYHDKCIEFQPGINVIYGENESGKSTLHTFIQGIFFGIRRMRGRASKSDVYSRFEPWENPGCYQGQINFQCGGKLFRLERDFHKDHAKVELICVSDGERLSVGDGDLNILLGNISESIYDNTVSVGQLRSKTNNGLVTELRNYMANYQGGLDGHLDIEQALSVLKEKRKVYEYQQKGGREAKERLLDEMQLKISYLQEEIQLIAHKVLDSETGRENLSKDSDDKKTKRIWSFPAFSAVTIAMITGLILMPGLIGKSVWAGAALLFVCGRILVFSKAEGSTVHDQQEENRKRMEWNVENLLESAKEKKAALGNLQDEYQELQMQGSDNDPVKEELDSIMLAMETIRTLARDTQNGIGIQLKRRTAQILGELTDGKYINISIDEEFHVGVSTQERYIPLGMLSTGTIEQVYFALRMAAGEILCAEEPMPVLLDEVFAMYDEERLIKTLHWLGKKKEQVLLFTCHKREAELLSRMQVGYTLIKL